VASGGRAVMTPNGGNGVLANWPGDGSQDNALSLQLDATVSGDFDVWVDYQTVTTENKGAALTFYGAANRYCQVEVLGSAGGSSCEVFFAVAWASGSTNCYWSSSITGVATSGQTRIRRVGNAVSGYWRASSGDAWTQVGASQTPSTPLPTTGNIQLVAEGTSFTCSWDNLVV
jgi:hypothetical protein